MIAGCASLGSDAGVDAGQGCAPIAAAMSASSWAISAARAARRSRRSRSPTSDCSWNSRASGTRRRAGTAPASSSSLLLACRTTCGRYTGRGPLSLHGAKDAVERAAVEGYGGFCRFCRERPCLGSVGGTRPCGVLAKGNRADFRHRGVHFAGVWFVPEVVNASGTPVAALYIRTSTEKQFTGNQRPEIERLVEARGYEVRAVYEEQVSAAAKVRPQYDRMMQDAHAGNFGVVVIWSLDRLGRSMLGNLQAVLDLDRRGVLVVSVKEPWLDSHSGPTRQLLLGVLGWVAEQERVRIGERVRAGLARVKKSGQQLGRPRTHVPLPVVRALRDQGMSIRAIGKELGVAPSIVHRALSRQPLTGGDPQVGDHT